MLYLCLLANAFHLDQFQLIGNLLGGLKRPRCSRRPVNFGLGYGLKLGAPLVGFSLISRKIPDLVSSMKCVARRGQDRILRRKLASSFEKIFVLVNSEIFK